MIIRVVQTKRNLKHPIYTPMTVVRRTVGKKKKSLNQRLNVDRPRARVAIRIPTTIKSKFLDYFFEQMVYFVYLSYSGIFIFNIIIVDQLLATKLDLRSQCISVLRKI